MLVRMRSEVLAHIKLTHYQYNAEFFQKNINKKGNREGIDNLFTDPTIRKNIEVDLSVADHLQEEIVQLENYIIRKTKAFDPRTYYRLQTVPGIGQVLALTILYDKSAGQPICTARLPEGLHIRMYAMISEILTGFQPCNPLLLMPG
jgi:hypothetical protein